MRAVFAFLTPLILAIFVFLGFTFFLDQQEGKGALQVTSVPQSAVYVDGAFVGNTPLCRCEGKDMLATGDHGVRLVPKEGNFAPFEDKIAINKATLSVVDRTFGEGAGGEGSIITLTKIPDKKDAQVLVLSFPDKATISLDDNPSGVSPLLLKNIPESDHDLYITKEGYKEKILRIRTVPGYKLTSLIFLGVAPSSSSSASTTSAPYVQKIVILNTPTGFLRVRENPTLGSAQIGQVSPGETYDLLDEKEGWYRIKLGWVSSDYAQKQ